jgi:hypothetical protein
MVTSNLRLAWLTRNNGDAGSSDNPVLIVNDDGEEKVHYTVWGPGGAGVAGMQVVAKPFPAFDVAALTNSSVRVGLRGDDQWQPELLFVFGEDSSGGPIPIALGLDIQTKLSTDAAEGNISLPLRKVRTMEGKEIIEQLLIIIRTDNDDYSGTDSPVAFDLVTNFGATPTTQIVSIPETPQEDLEEYVTNVYLMPLAPLITKERLSEIRVRIDGDDMWLPKQMFIFGIGNKTSNTAPAIPLVYQSNWSFGPLSTDSSEGKSSIVLPIV